MFLDEMHPTSTQAVVLRTHREKLHLFGFSAELQPFSPAAAGPQLQLPARLWSEADLCSFERPAL